MKSEDRTLENDHFCFFLGCKEFVTYLSLTITDLNRDQLTDVTYFSLTITDSNRDQLTEVDDSSTFFI